MTADGTPGTKNQPQFLTGGAPDLAVDSNAVSDYAAKVGNRRVGTTVERNAAAGADVWEGLLWGDTTTLFEYRRTAGTWVVVLEDTVFFTPALNVGWTNEAGNGLQYKRRNGVVYLRGRASSSGADLAAFTLPVGFRPDATATMVFPVDVNLAATARAYVTTVGVVQASAGTLISFDNLRFPIL